MKARKFIIKVKNYVLASARDRNGKLRFARALVKSGAEV